MGNDFELSLYTVLRASCAASSLTSWAFLPFKVIGGVATSGGYGRVWLSNNEDLGTEDLFVLASKAGGGSRSWRE